MTYTGGKNGGGSYQRIINYMPPHTAYIEGFLGSGAVIRNKRPAKQNVGVDRSSLALSLCLDLSGEKAREFNLIEGDILACIESLGPFIQNIPFIQQDSALFYFDPPYLMETRKGGTLYDFELDVEGHENLLDISNNARAMVMISGYRSALYDRELKHWNRVDYMTQTRRGMVQECLWFNFKEPSELHDYAHLGKDFRERERIKRKKARQVARFKAMDRLERLAVMDALKSL